MSAASGRVGLVIVSHSSKIAHGIVELAAQMAAGTTILAAGGTDEDGIGTSFEKVSAAMTDADGGAGVVVLCDLGSAILTAETALDFLEDDLRERVEIVDAPVVEGAVAAAVAAESGGDRAAVVAAARTAIGMFADPDANAAEPTAASTDTPKRVSGTATLRNPEGLHARPAADFAKLATTFDAEVEVEGVNAKSLLRIMSLGLRAGTAVTITAAGAEAERAVRELVELVESGFGEAHG